MSDEVSIPVPEFRGSRAGRYGTGQRVVSGGMDPDMKRMALFAGGIAAVLAVLFAASALMGHRSAEVPVIAPAPGPVRVKPENPGGLKIDASENDLFSGGTDTGAAKLSPPAEAPDTKALRAGAPPAAPPPIAQAAPPLPPAPPKPAAVASAAAKPVAAPAGKTMVQLAALGSEEAARAEWQLMTKKMPDILAGHQPNYSKTEHDGHVFWRVRTSGFADVAQARTFCDRVRAKGGGCSVADF